MLICGYLCIKIRYMEVTSAQIGFMRQAIRLAEENVRSGGGPFGAVVVREGKIIGTGVNRVTSSLDPTAHAEINAIREACRNLATWQLDGCEIYSSCEPCPMCLGAIYWARPAALYFANTREDAASIQFDDAFIYRELQQPVESRSIPTVQLLREEGLSVFASWEATPGKIQY
jgi:guanine deaminase